MRVSFLEIAKIEYNEAIDFYNKEKFGLGYEFSVEVDKTLQKILLFPNAWPFVSKRVR